MVIILIILLKDMAAGNIFKEVKIVHRFEFYKNVWIKD